MGWEMHLTRARLWHHSDRFPIGRREWVDLVHRSADLRSEGDAGLWGDGEERRWLQYHDGGVKVKRPGAALLRRLADLAGELDAWLEDDNASPYRLVDGELTARPWSLEELGEGLRVTRTPPLWLEPEEWWRLVAAEPDFRVDTGIQASLPSGTRTVACPPVACWTGHPAGVPVPFFYESWAPSPVSFVEVERADGPIAARMGELARLLDAELLDGHDEPATPGRA